MSSARIRNTPEELRKHIDPQALDHYAPMSGEMVDIVQVDAQDLVTHERLDIVIRYLFVDSTLSYTVPCHFGQRLYWMYLYYGGRKYDRYFIDLDGRKHNFQDYFFNFCQIVDDMRRGRFDFGREAVAISAGMALGGAHRLAAAAMLQREIRAVELVGDKGQNRCDYKALQRMGFPPRDIDFVVYKYMELKGNCHILYVFPEGISQLDAVRTTVQAFADIIYEKSILLTEQGVNEIIKLCYGHNVWWQDSLINKFRTERFLDKGGLQVFVIHLRDDPDCTRLKAEVRKLSRDGSGTGIIHSTDSFSEAISSAQTLLNDNSLYFLNHRRRTRDVSLDQKLAVYRDRIAATGRPHLYAIDTGAVMGLFGLREINDIDYLCAHVQDPVVQDDICSLHNDDYLAFGLNPFELVMDPTNHFYYNGMKVLTLDAVMRFKARRSSAKDIKDLDTVRRFISMDSTLAFQLRSRKHAARLQRSMKSLEKALKQTTLVRFIRRKLGKKV